MNSQLGSSASGKLQKPTQILKKIQKTSPTEEDQSLPKSGSLRVNIHAKTSKPLRKTLVFQNIKKSGVIVKKRTESAGQKSKSYNNLKGIGKIVNEPERKSKSPSPNQLYFKKNAQTINFSKSVSKLLHENFVQPTWIPGGNSASRHSQEPKLNNFMSAKTSKNEPDLYTQTAKLDIKRKSIQSSASSNFVRYKTLETTDGTEFQIPEEISEREPNFHQKRENSLPRQSLKAIKKPQFNSQEAANLQVLKEKYHDVPLIRNSQGKRHYASTSPTPVESLVEEVSPKPILDFQNCIINLQKTNGAMRSKIQKIGLAVSGLANASYNLNKEIRSKHVKEISNNIESINTLFNDVHFQILQNDDNLNFLDKSWQNSLSHNKNIKKIENLDGQLRKLTEMHHNLQQRMFDQTVENKRVVQGLQSNMNENHDKNYMKSFQIENLEKMLSESREDNKYLIRRIDELTRDLVSKPQEKSVAEKPEKPIWRANSEKLMMQSLKFLTAMRSLQKCLKSEDKEKIQQAKQEFEVNKKILEQMLKQTNKMLVSGDSIPMVAEVSPISVVNLDENREFQQQRDQITILMQQLHSQQEQITDSKSQITLKDIEIAKIQSKFENIANQNLLLQKVEPIKKNLKSLHTQTNIQLQVEPIKKNLKSLHTQTTIQLQVDQNLQTISDSDLDSSKNLTKKVTELEQTAEEYEQQFKTQDQAIKNLREQNKALSISQSEKIGKLQKEIAEQNEIVKDKDVENDQKCNEFQMQIQGFEGLIQGFEAQIQDFELQINDFEIQKTKYEIQITDLDKVNQDMTSDFNLQNNDFKNKLFEQENNEKDLQAQIQTKTNIIDEQTAKTSQELEKLKYNHSRQIDIIGQAKASLQQEFDNLKKEMEKEAEAKKEENKQQQNTLQDEIKQLNEDLVQAEQIRGKHQSTLEKNRDLISLLKEQLQKSVEKQKEKPEIQKQKLELLISENNKVKKESEKLQNQNQTLREQVKELKLQFQEKMSELSKENLEKEDLINEANKAIEEMNEEKHEVKAKFKHLIQVYAMNISQSINQSSYKGDDSSLSIGDCFDQIQEVLENGQVSKDDRLVSHVLSPRDSKAFAVLSSDLDSHHLKLSGIQKSLEIANEMLSQNDEEIKRQSTVIETAQRKINKYKNAMKLKIEAMKRMEGEKKEMEYKLLQEKAKEPVALVAPVAQVEPVKLVAPVAPVGPEKLVASQEDKLQLEKLQEEKFQEEIKKIEQKLKSEFDIKISSYEEKIKLLESKKDSSSSSSSDNLETENMELLAKLQKTEKDLQDLRAHQNPTVFVEQKIDDTKLKEILEKLNLIQNKLVAAKGEVVQKIREELGGEIEGIRKKYCSEILNKSEHSNLPNGDLKQIKEIKVRNQTYLVIEAAEATHFVEKEKLTQQQLDFVQSFMPECRNEIEIPFALEQAENPNQNVDQFEQQIKDLRQEKDEVLKEYYDFRISLEKNADLVDEKDIHLLKDDAQFFTAENLELRVKIKQLIEYNILNKQRIEELLLQKDTQNQDLSRIFKDAGSILKGELQDLANSSLDLFDDSGLVEIQSISEQPQKNMTIESKNDTQVSVLQQQFEDANLKLQNLHKQLQDAKTWGAIKIIKRMQGPEEQKSIFIDISNDDSRDSGNSYRNLLNHVKGTLQTYLKKIPIIDVQNEMLLKIIFSMMNFTSQEISDLQAIRQELPSYKIDNQASKKKEKERINHSQNRVNSSQNRVNSSQNNSSNTEGDNDSLKINSKSKTGILGLFKKNLQSHSRNMQYLEPQLSSKPQTPSKSSMQSPKGSSSESHHPVPPPINRFKNRLPDDSDLNL